MLEATSVPPRLECIDERFADSVFPMGAFGATFAGSTTTVRTKARGIELEIAERSVAVVFATGGERIFSGSNPPYRPPGTGRSSSISA